MTDNYKFRSDAASKYDVVPLKYGQQDEKRSICQMLCTALNIMDGDSQGAAVNAVAWRLETREKDRNDIYGRCRFEQGRNALQRHHLREDRGDDRRRQLSCERTTAAGDEARR
ncbi:hypothetical protein CUJ84_pRLN1001075 (plasmid) [Rhizobium leguminosarum]|uniref:Uncharacterized protein n=1 Tax=Rhizobium leguminosarum TaxID=384 RepID=A0A2K9ZE66_RHILE|nr:hypothetical protein CUJ84_pRLN1001075 [Rhizobium leguminosarum]